MPLSCQLRAAGLELCMSSAADCLIGLDMMDVAKYDNDVGVKSDHVHSLQLSHDTTRRYGSVSSVNSFTASTYQSDRSSACLLACLTDCSSFSTKSSLQSRDSSIKNCTELK